jgi:hypothetical protein
MSYLTALLHSLSQCVDGAVLELADCVWRSIQDCGYLVGGSALQHAEADDIRLIRIQRIEQLVNRVVLLGADHPLIRLRFIRGRFGMIGNIDNLWTETTPTIAQQVFGDGRKIGPKGDAPMAVAVERSQRPEKDLLGSVFGFGPVSQVRIEQGIDRTPLTPTKLFERLSITALCFANQPFVAHDSICLRKWERKGRRGVTLLH